MGYFTPPSSKMQQPLSKAAATIPVLEGVQSAQGRFNLLPAVVHTMRVLQGTFKSPFASTASLPLALGCRIFPGYCAGLVRDRRLYRTSVPLCRRVFYWGVMGEGPLSARRIVPEPEGRVTLPSRRTRSEPRGEGRGGYPPRLQDPPLGRDGRPQTDRALRGGSGARCER